MKPTDEEIVEDMLIAANDAANDDDTDPAAVMLVAYRVARAHVLDEAARVVRPTSRRPCACDRCDCGNQDNYAEVAVWDSENQNAKRIFALKDRAP